jgi:hypothetical protein
MKSGVSPSSALFMVISLTLETHLAAIYGGLVSSFTTKHLSIIVQAARFSATVQDRSGFHDKKDKTRYFFVFIKKDTNTRAN